MEIGSAVDRLMPIFGFFAAFAHYYNLIFAGERLQRKGQLDRLTRSEYTRRGRTRPDATRHGEVCTSVSVA